MTPLWSSLLPFLSWNFELTYPIVYLFEYPLKHYKVNVAKLKHVIRVHQRGVLRITKDFLSWALRLGRDVDGSVLKRL